MPSFDKYLSNAEGTAPTTACTTVAEVRAVLEPRTRVPTVSGTVSVRFVIEHVFCGRDRHRCLRTRARASVYGHGHECVCRSCTSS